MTATREVGVTARERAERTLRRQRKLIVIIPANVPLLVGLPLALAAIFHFVLPLIASAWVN